MTAVDVVIPCYNYGHYLHACINSVLAQEDVDIRILIIDDASPDNTAEICSELAASDDRINYVIHHKNIGHIATYNEGLLDWCTSEYCVLLSADDLLVTGALKRAVTIMDNDKNIGLVYGRPYYFEKEACLPRFRSYRTTAVRWPGRKWIECICRDGQNVISAPEVVVRRTVQRAVGGYRSELPHTADLEMWLRVAAVSDVAYVRGVPQAYYRRHECSMSRSRFYRERTADLLGRKAAFDAFFDHHQATLPDCDRLREITNRALAREALWRACRAYDRNRIEEASAEELVRFAGETYPAIGSVPEYAALRRRQWLGPAICSRTQVFAPPAIVRRLRGWLQQQRWKKEGVYRRLQGSHAGLV